jgi:dolichol-phosphate mannosyltransferase
MKHPMISIILPTYNEKEGIISLLNNIHEVCRKISHEVIIVDDHSPDGTFRLLEQFARTHPWAHPLLHQSAPSLGASIGHGVKHARGDIIVGMDADGNHNPHTIPLLLRKLKEADLVIGSRFIPTGGMENGFRYWTSRAFNIFLRYVFGFPITDNTSGFYAIQKKKLLSLNLKKIFYGYGEYHLRLVWIAQKSHMNIQEIPVFYAKRLGGQSKSRFFPMIHTYLRVAHRLSQENN